MRPRVLVVDDDPAMGKLLGDHLGREGWRVDTVTDGATAQSLLARERFDVMLTDLVMDDVNGLALLRAARAAPSRPGVLLMTAFADMQSAITALRLGAVDYLSKPFRLDDVTAAVKRTLEHRVTGSASPRISAARPDDYGDLVGSSRAMRAVVQEVRAIADTEATVLLLGESGTGKELVARALHRNSQRRAGPFVAVNCAAIPESLLESELFGHVKGAFTGADHPRRGLFADANTGTLFLDEMAEMPLHLQCKLLRVLQDKIVRPVGGGPEIQLDFRLVTATNRDLGALVQGGRFREDLYYRVAVMAIRLPSLRERPEDVPVLARHFLDRLTAERGGEATGFTEDAERALLAHPWPGNVRELQNAVERAATLAQGPLIGVPALALDAGTAGVTTGQVRPTIETLTRRYAEQVLAETSGDKVRAARILGVSLRTVQRWCKAR
jgi:DNA-binding NtrC family response regulator